MILRRATADDAPGCAAIVDAWLDGLHWMAERPDRATLEGLLRDGLPRRDAWVAEDAGAVAGYVSCDAAEGHVHTLYVARPGAGTGRLLLDRVRRGRDRLTLNTHAPNHAAHRFYAREGFVAVQTDLPGADGVPEIRMEWRR